jgi:hypothetical protein
MHAAGRHPIEKFRIGAFSGDRLDHFELNVADIAERHAVIDGGGAAAEPAVFDNDLAQHHEAGRAELGIQMREARVKVRHHVADLEERSRQRTT